MRPERRPRCRNGGAASSRPRSLPFWRESDKSQGFGDRVPKSPPTASVAAGRSLCVAGSCYGAPAPRAALEHVTVMEDAVKHGGNRGHVAEQFAPVFHRSV